MIVECRTCPVQGQRCEGCMVTALEAMPAPGGDVGLALDAAQRRAVQLFVDAGLLRPQDATGLWARVEPDQRQASG